MQGDILDNDENKEDDDDNDDDDNDDDNNNHTGMEYNATVYDGRENAIATVKQARLSASPSSANVAASISPDLSTLSRIGLIAAANEALRVQRLRGICLRAKNERYFAAALKFSLLPSSANTFATLASISFHLI